MPAIFYEKFSTVKNCLYSEFSNSAFSKFLTFLYRLFRNFGDFPLRQIYYSNFLQYGEFYFSGFFSRPYKRAIFISINIFGTGNCNEHIFKNYFKLIKIINLQR